MIRKVIEHWLTSTTEREYQFPFCQLLSSQGHRIIHVSSHGPGEHGKDVVTIARDGRVCAYQLKTGNLGIKEWREYQGEIIDLVSTKVRHPSVDRKRGWHASYFVTNGRLTPDVKRSITMINEDHEGQWSQLGTIEFDELLGDFIRLQGDFYPTELQDTKRFLELLLADGREQFPNGQFSQLLLTMLPLEEKDAKPPKTACKRAIASSMLTAAYIGQQYAEQGNHFALADLWIVFMAHILGTAERFQLDDKYWCDTYNLAILALESVFADAMDEVEKRSDEIQELVEGVWMGDFVTLRPRLLKLTGYLAAFALYRRIAGADDWRVPVVDKVIERYGRLFLLSNAKEPYGEAATPLQLVIACYVEFAGRLGEASALIGLLIDIILAFSRRERGGLPNPYYNTEAAF